MSKPPVIWRKLDRCQICNRLVHRHNLRMALMNDVKLEAQNYLSYSSYNSSGWTAVYGTGVDTGLISMGTKESYRIRVNNDNTLDEINGSQTWTGQELFYTAEIDVSAWTSFCFSAYIGAYQQSAEPILCAAAVYWPGGGFTYPQRELTITGRSTRVTFAYRTDDADFKANYLDYSPGDTELTNLRFAVYGFAGGSGDPVWWFDDAQLERDVLTPGTFLQTTGSSAVIPATIDIKSVIKVCPSCRKQYFHTFRGYVPREVIEPLEVDIEVLP